MSVLAIPSSRQLGLRPPRRMPAPRVAPAFSFPSVPFFGRTLTEYTRFFALEPDLLRGRDVLDVGAGPSSFAAEACARRIQAVAVDPWYREPVERLTTQIDADYAWMLAEIRAKRRMFRVGRARSEFQPARGFESLEAAEADRRLAAQRFLADYAVHAAHGRYVGAALPFLPFFDRTFDLVLCAHLLFIQAARFDFDWHLNACRELVRVSADEVRIHPLCGPDGKPYAKLPALRRELRELGIESRVDAVDYEFFSGSDTTLVLRRAPAPAAA